MPAQNPWTTAGVANILTPGCAVGDVFYVDGENGSDSVLNAGVDPASPLLTITRALELCTDDENDVVIVLNYPEAAPPAGEATPIAVNKNRVHLLGAAYPYAQGDMKAYVDCPPGAAAAVFLVSARWVEIAYFKIGGGATFGGIELTGAIETKGLSVHHCQFAEKVNAAGPPTYGIDCTEVNCGNWMYVGDCTFYPAISSHAITINNAANPRIIGNHFVCVGGNGVYLGQGASGYGAITDNYFAIDADGAVGKAIFIDVGGTYGFLVANNMANEGITDMGSNPFWDVDAGAPKNAWMGNYLGITPTQP